MAVLLAGALPALAGVETEIEEGIGRWIAEAFIAQRGRLDQPPIADWVSEVGNDLLIHTPRDDLTYHFVVLDSPEANGFALPGGWIFITAGLLETMDSEDELAAIMAHELAHMVDRDFQRMVKRTAMWLAVAQILREADRDDWVPLVQAAQLVNTLRHSRRQEAQADHVGARIAWDAGYHPLGIADFLGTEGSWSYLETVFATHPDRNRRAEWLVEHVSEFRSEDPEGALRLANSLLLRGRCAVAAEMMQEPLAPGYEQQREELLLRTEHCRVTAVRPKGMALPVESSASLRDGVEKLAQARAEADKPTESAWRMLRRIRDDRQLGQALTLAQVIDPQLTDVAYLALLAQTVDLLHRTLRGADLLSRSINMRSSTTGGLTVAAERAAVARAAEAEAATLEGLAEGLREVTLRLTTGMEGESEELARLAGGYHRAGRLVAPLLIELAEGGAGDGRRLTFSRFMILQGQVRMLAMRMDDLDESAEEIAAEQWGASVRLRRAQLDLIGIEAAPSAREALVPLVARRVRAEPSALIAAWSETGGLGEAALALLEEQLEPDDDPFGSRLRAKQIIMRLASIEAQEQVAWAKTEKQTAKGADRFALRGAI